MTNDTTSVFNIRESITANRSSLVFVDDLNRNNALKTVSEEIEGKILPDGCIASTGSESNLSRVESVLETLRNRVTSVLSVVLNQLSIRYSVGIGLDSVGALFRKSRKFAEPTRIRCRFWGVKDTVVPEGTLVADDFGKTFKTQNEIVLSQESEDGFQADGYAVSVERGRFEMPVDTVTNIVSGVIGLYKVTNIEVGDLGVDEENDFEFRRRILKSRYNGSSFVGAIVSRVMSITDVRDCIVFENGTSDVCYVSSDGTVYEKDVRPGGREDGRREATDVAIAPHGIVVIVDGGSGVDVCKSLFETVPPGTDTTPLYIANTSSEYYAYNVNLVPEGVQIDDVVKHVTENDSIYGIAYSMYYNTGTPVRFKSRVTVIRNKWNLSDDELVERVKDSVSAWQQGQSLYVDRLSLGQNVYRFELAAAVSDYVSEIQMKNVELFVQDGSGEFVTVPPVHVPIYGFAKCERDDVEVVIYGK